MQLLGPKIGLKFKFCTSCLEDPLGTIHCRSHHEELTRQDPMVDDLVIAIVRLLDLEGLHMVPSIELDHALNTAIVER
nr:hypothetical protein CFP56_65647 [Quercus suber]